MTTETDRQTFELLSNSTYDLHTIYFTLNNVYKDDLQAQLACLTRFKDNNEDCFISLTTYRAFFEKRNVEIRSFQEATDSIMDIFKSMANDSSLATIPHELVAHLVTGLTSSALSLVTSFYHISASNQTTTGRVLDCATIVASLTNLATMIYSIAKHWRIVYDIERAKSSFSTLTNMLSAITRKPNFDSNTVQTAVGVIISVILAGTSLCHSTSGKKMVELGSVSRALRSFRSDAKDMVTFVCEDILKLDLQGDADVYSEVVQLAHRSNELILMEPYRFVIAADLGLELERFPKQATDAIAKVIHSKTQASALISAKNLLVQNLQQVKEKLNSVHILQSQKDRPETLGIYLAGEPAVGKSTLTRYLTNKLAATLELNSDLYNLNRDDKGFFIPYGAQPFGVYNEFLVNRAENEGLLRTYTGLVSSDPYNLESAHLDGKSQPAQFRAIYITSNQVSPDLTVTGGLSVDGAKAFWDRTLKFEIRDPLCTGRNGSGNIHRQPDYSHLTVIYHKKRGNLVTQEQMTVQEMYKMLLTTIISREIAWHTKLDNPPAERLAFLRNLQTVTPNAGNDYFVVRFSGTPQTGKTRMAEIVRSMLTGHFSGMPVYRYMVYSPDPAIYILDDLVYTEGQHRAYFSFINQMNKRSIVLFLTNTEYDQKSVWNYLPPSRTLYWNIPKIDSLPSGIVRRLGISGSAQYGEERFYSNPAGLHFQFSAGFKMTHLGEIVDESSLKQTIFTTYAKFIGTPDEIMIIPGQVVLAQEPDIEIISPNFEELTETLRSPIKTFAAFTGNGTTKFSVSTSYLTLANGKTFVDEWCIGKDPLNEENFTSVASRLAAAARRFKRNVVINAVVGDFLLKYADNAIHVPDENSRAVEITENNNMIYLGGKPITKEQYSLYHVGTPPLELTEWPQDYLLKVKSYVTSKTTPLAVTYHTDAELKLISRTIDIDAASRALLWIKDNKLLTLCMSIISGYLVYKGASALFFPGKNKKKYSPNFTVSDVDDAFEEHTRELQLAVRRDATEGTNVHARAARARAAQDGLAERLSEWEYDWRSNSKKADTLARHRTKGNYEAIEKMVQSDPTILTNYFKNKEANMLTMRNTAFSPPSQLDNFVKSIENNYVVIHSSLGSCYGLAFTSNLILTVSHMFAEIGEYAVVDDNDIQYRGKVRALTRHRDIAILEITDKTWPMKKDLRKFIHSDSKFTNLPQVWYCRMGIPPLYVQGPATFQERPVPMTNPLVPTFLLSSNVWEVDFWQHSNLSDIIREGDCGMPLIAKVDNGFKIVGIHCSFDTYDSAAQFASISLSDLKMVVPNADITVKPRPGFFNPKNNKLTYAHPIVIEGAEPSALKRSHTGNPLAFWGYSDELNFRSHPKCKKFFRANPHLTNEVWPAALRFDERRMDPTNLQKDKFGKPHTLLTQAVLYTVKQPTYRTWNPEIYEQTKLTIAQRYKRDYPDLADLNLFKIINGADNLSGLDMTTSCGPILKKLFGISTKEEVFTNVSNPEQPPLYQVAQNTIGEAFLNEFHNIQKSWNSGTACTILSKDNAKVELLPINKVKAGKVRLFNEVDVGFNCALKKIFGDLVSRCQSTWHKGPYAMGANHYLLGSYVNKNFSKIKGEIQNTDYSRFDKTIPAELIFEFCDVALARRDPSYRKAVADTLTYVLHTIEGNLYMVSGGNESGTYVTTLLNCFVVEFVNYYTAIEKFHNLYSYYPTLGELDRMFVQYICGDDATLKVTQGFFTMEDRIRVNSMFNLVLTDAKVDSDLPSFCSRVYYPDPSDRAVAYPALKKSSITTCLQWFTHIDGISIAQNVNTALFEASLHDKEFFDQVEKACLYLHQKYNLCGADWIPYETYRKNFSRYIRGNATSPFECVVYDADNKAQRSMFQNIPQNKFEEILKQPNFILEHNTREMDSLAYINHYAQINSLPQMVVVATKTGPEERPTWTAVCTMATKDGAKLEASGNSLTKKSATRAACDILAPMLMNRIVKPNFDTTITKDTKTLTLLNSRINKILEAYPECDKLFLTPCTSEHQELIVTDILSVELDNVISCSHTLQICDQGHHIKRCDAEIAKKHFAVLENHHGTFVSTNDSAFEPSDEEVELTPTLTHEVTPNMQPETVTTHQDVIAQAAVNEAMSTLPNLSNPQPSLVTPTMAAPGETGLSNQQLAQVDTLNPIGPPPMLSFGAIDFDIKTLAYSQYVDTDLDISWTENLLKGTILAQIPYDPTSQYANKYMRAWVNLHERYAGDILIRVTVLGNPLYSGYLGIGWVPKFQTGTTVQLSDMMTYSYIGKGVTEPFTTIQKLGDARKDHFFREVGDTDVQNRPHLVIFPMITVQNPLKDGVTVRMLIGSKFMNPAEAAAYSGIPFMAVKPVVTELPNYGTNTSVVQTGTPGYAGLSVMNLIPEIKAYTDGPTCHTDTSNGYNFIYSDEVLNSAGVGCKRFGNISNPIPMNPSDVALTDTPQYDWPNEDEIPNTYRANHFMHISGSISPEDFTDMMLEYGEDNVERFISKIRTKRYPELVAVTSCDIKQYFGAYTSNAFYRLALWESFKIVSTFGTIVIKHYIMYSAPPPNTSGGLLTAYHMSLALFGKVLKAPVFHVDGTSIYFQNATALPLGTKALVFTSIPPSALTIDNYRSPTAMNDSRFVSMMLTSLPAYDKDTHVAEVTFIDPRTLKTVLVARYEKETGFYIREDAGSFYKVCPLELQQLSFYVRVMAKSSDFPTTDTYNWVARTSPLAVQQQRELVFSSCQPNMAAGAMLPLMLIGGGMQGIGGAIGGYSQMKFQDKMALRGMDFAREMKQGGWEQEIMMQQNAHMQQQHLQNTQIGAQMGMQQMELDTRKYMQDLDLTNRRNMQTRDFQQQYAMKGFSSPSQFL